MKCPECGGVNRPGSKYCEYCGASLSQFCPECGERIDKDKSYCPNCGAEVDPGKSLPEKVSYNFKAGDTGFRYAWVVSKVLLPLEAVLSILLVITGGSAHSVHLPGYFSYTASSVVPPYSIALFVLSVVACTGIGKFKKSSYVLLLIIHALLLLRDVGGIRRCLLFISSPDVLWLILYSAALVCHILSLIYFVKRESFYKR